MILLNQLARFILAGSLAGALAGIALKITGQFYSFLLIILKVRVQLLLLSIMQNLDELLYRKLHVAFHV